MNNDLNNSMHSEESARANLGAGDRLRVENGSGENHDVRGADEMAAQRAHQGVDIGQGGIWCRPSILLGQQGRRECAHLVFQRHQFAP